MSETTLLSHDILVNLSPDEVLNRAEAYFARRWPYGGRFSRTGNVSVDLIAEIEVPPYWLLDLLKLVVLSSLTLGIHFLWWAFKPYRPVAIKSAHVVATRARRHS